MDAVQRAQIRYMTGDLYEAVMTDPDIHWSHEWLACCPECGTLNTREVNVSRPYGWVSVDRECGACGYVSNTKVMTCEHDDDIYDDDYEHDGGDSAWCERCHGTRGEPFDDGVTPCEACDGTGYKWEYL